MAQNAAAVERCRQVLSDLRGGVQPDFAMLSVAMRDVRGMHDEQESPLESAAGAAAPKGGGKKAKSKTRSKKKGKAA